MRQTLVALLLCFSAWAHAGGVSVGDVAPAVELPSLGEPETVTLASLAGKVVYLDFWASWCGPCRVSFPQLEEIRTEFAERGFEVFAISVDEERADALEFLAEVPVSYPVVHDAEGITPQAYQPIGMPTGYLIDRSGVVRHVHKGYKKSDGEKLRSEIINLLGEDGVEISD
jgi:thiol-disulfide isomerase/thioredoxin